MDSLFLDANVLFSAAYLPGSTLRAHWSLPNVELLSSTFARFEAESNLASKRPAQLPEFASLLQSVITVADAPPGAILPPGLLLPDKDEPIFAAQHAAASHLLTGDVRHFGPYFGQTFAGVRIERPGIYLLSRKSSP